MSTELNNLQFCVNRLEAASARCAPNETMTTVIEAVAHLAEYCRTRVADHPALYPYQLDASIANLCARIEALESSAEALASLATENPAVPLWQAVERTEPDQADWERWNHWRPRPPVGKPARDEWDHLLDAIGTDCNRYGWSDLDALTTWQMGRAAMLQARLHGARFRYERAAEAGEAPS